MRIGKQDAPYTAICTSDAESITVRGKDLVGEIIGQMDFTSYFWLLVTGQQPNERPGVLRQRDALRARRARARCRAWSPRA